MKTLNRFHGRRIPGLVVAVLLISGLGPPVWSADPALSKLAGYVDGSAFVKLAGTEAVSVEISLHGALLRALSKFDPEVAPLVRGLESIQAVIIDLKSDDESKGSSGVSSVKLAEAIGALETRLRGAGWQRMARMREREADVQILVLNDADVIRGLVVLVIDRSEGKMIFTNVAGVLDMAALEKIGERLDLPGLDSLAP
jgi:hypothetical protein